MNYIRHLSAFFQYAKKDMRLSANHISIYISLFQYWNLNRFQNPFTISRIDMMQMSRIGSKNTYAKCLRQLHEYGYIFYTPSKKVYQPSMVGMVRLDQSVKPDPQQLGLFDDALCTKNDTQQMPENEAVRSTGFDTHMCPKNDTTGVPILTHPCPKNGTHMCTDFGTLLKLNYKHNTEREENTPTQKNKNNHHEEEEKTVPPVSQKWYTQEPETEKSLPSLSTVHTFFIQEKYPPREAQKFFHHYQANGWKLGGKTPITNWQAAAHKWMINGTPSNTNHATPKPGNLHTGEDKNYSQPL